MTFSLTTASVAPLQCPSVELLDYSQNFFAMFSFVQESKIFVPPLLHIYILSMVYARLCLSLLVVEAKELTTMAELCKYFMGVVNKFMLLIFRLLSVARNLCS
jgi:hypothetical protein